MVSPVDPHASDVPPPSPAVDRSDWPAQAADAVVRVVDQVRDRTTKPALTALRAVVFGLVIVAAALMATVLLLISLVRIFDAYLPGDVWSAYLVLGLAFTIGGLVLWTLRHPRP